MPPAARSRTTVHRALSWIGLALLWALAAVLLVLGVELAGALAG